MHRPSLSTQATSINRSTFFQESFIQEEGSLIVAGYLANTIENIANQLALMSGKMQPPKTHFYIEHCVSCENHPWHTFHKTSRYEFFFTKIANYIKKKIPSAKVFRNVLPEDYSKVDRMKRKIWDKTQKRYLYFPRLGGFEIFWNGDIIYSKRKEQKWPTLELKRYKKKVVEELPQETQEERSIQDTTQQEETEQEENKIEPSEKKVVGQKIRKDQDDEVLSQRSGFFEFDRNVEITMAFEMELSLHRMNTRIIDYHNCDSEASKFELKSSHPQYMEAKQRVLIVGANQGAKFSLRFKPVDEPADRQYVLSVKKNGQMWDNILFSVSYKP